MRFRFHSSFTDNGSYIYILLVIALLYYFKVGDSNYASLTITDIRVHPQVDCFETDTSDPVILSSKYCLETFVLKILSATTN